MLNLLRLANYVSCYYLKKIFSGLLELKTLIYPISHYLTRGWFRSFLDIVDLV